VLFLNSSVVVDLLELCKQFHSYSKYSTFLYLLYLHTAIISHAYILHQNELNYLAIKDNDN